MLPSLWAGCCLGGKTSAGLISALIAERTTRDLLLQALTGQDVVIHVSGGKKQKFTQILCAVITSLWKESSPSGESYQLSIRWRCISRLHLIPQQNLKTPSRSSSLSRQPCFFFFFFFSFLKIYIFLFVFVLLLLQTVKDKTLIANGCIRKKNGKKNLQKKRTLKKKKNHKKLPSLSL